VNAVFGGFDGGLEFEQLGAISASVIEEGFESSIGFDLRGV